MPCLISEEGISIVGETASQVSEHGDLVVRNNEFLGGKSLQGVAQCVFVVVFCNGELTGGVVGAGKAPAFA